MPNGLTEAEELEAGLGLGEPYEPLPPPTAAEQARVVAERGYFAELEEILADLIARGAMYPERAADIWDNIDQYVTVRGLTPALPYWKTIQRQIAGKPLIEWYERMKPDILGANMSVEEKFRSLLAGHPRGGERGVIAEIRKDILATLSPAEAKKQQDIWDYESELGIATRYAPRYQPTYPSYQPTYEPFRPEPAFERERAGLKGTQPWKDWFERQYGTILRQFRATTAEPTEETWSQYLKRRKPELKEKWWGLGPYGRGERPSAFQPRIKTVGF